MRSIGAAEKALEYMVARMNDPRKKPFGKQLAEHGVMLSRVAESRIEIDAARLQVLNAAIMIDSADAKFALKEIAEAKVFVPRVALDVIDKAIQAYGGKGFQDFVIRKEQGFPNEAPFVNLLGIESPGLTSSLAIAEEVYEMLYRR